MRDDTVTDTWLQEWRTSVWSSLARSIFSLCFRLPKSALRVWHTCSGSNPHAPDSKLANFEVTVVMHWIAESFSCNSVVIWARLAGMLSGLKMYCWPEINRIWGSGIWERRYSGNSRHQFLGRLPKVDLIILEGGKMSVRPSVHKKFLQFQWNLVYR